MSEDISAFSFRWNGILSDTLGIYVSEFPAITRAKERVTEVKIPGRSGSLTLTEGEDIYEPYLKNCKCTILQNADVHAITKWLRGSGTVEFGNEQGYLYQARIVNQIDFAKIHACGTRQFTIPFYCQPLKVKSDFETKSTTLTQSGKNITNAGDVKSKPIVKVTAKGTVKLTIGGTAVTLKDLIDGIVLNWENGESYSLDGSTNMNTKVTGKIQSLPVGKSQVKWSLVSNGSSDGVTSVEVFHREKFV